MNSLQNIILCIIFTINVNILVSHFGNISSISKSKSNTTLKYDQYISNQLKINNLCDVCYKKNFCKIGQVCGEYCSNVCPTGTVYCKRNLKGPASGGNFYNASNVNFMEHFRKRKKKSGSRHYIENCQNKFIKSKINSKIINYKPINQNGFSFENKCPLQPLSCPKKAPKKYQPFKILEKSMKFANMTDFSEIFELVDALVDFLGQGKLERTVGPYTHVYENNPITVPNIYHIIWFSNRRTFSLLNFTAFISILRYTSAQKIFLHTNVFHKLIKNSYFQLLSCLAGERLEVVRIISPSFVFLDVKRSKWLNIKKLYHQADFYRILVLVKFGGIYWLFWVFVLSCIVTTVVFFCSLPQVTTNPPHVDDDIIILQNPPNQYLTSNNPTFSSESCISISNGHIISPKNSKFLIRFFSTYLDGTYNPAEYGQGSVIKLWALSTYFPDEVNLEETRMVRPSFHERGYLFESTGWSWIDVRLGFWASGLLGI